MCCELDIFLLNFFCTSEANGTNYDGYISAIGLASYPGLLRRRDKAWYPLFAHARVAVEFHRRRLSSYTFAVRDEYSSVFLAVREALLFAIYSDDCIVSSFLKL